MRNSTGRKLTSLEQCNAIERRRPLASQSTATDRQIYVMSKIIVVLLRLLLQLIVLDHLRALFSEKLRISRP
jgi:hypothetical protein